MGGLGNMMFQIAAAYSVALENDDASVFDFDKHHLPLQGRNIRKYENNIFRNVPRSTIEKNFHNSSRSRAQLFKNPLSKRYGSIWIFSE